MYCQFLLAAQSNFTMTAMAETLDTIAHDMIIEKDFGRNIELTSKLFSPSDGKWVNGLDITSMLWSDGICHIPVDYRFYAPGLDGKTKNDHFQDMLSSAKERKLDSKAVLFDSWFASLDNLKTITQYGWTWITELKKNRIINHSVRLENTDIPNEGLVCHLRGYGWIKVIKRVIKNDFLGYLATNDTSLTADDISQGYAERWKIEEYHRGLKQTTGIEECQARIGRIQRNHIFCSILAFLALEAKRIEEDVSWYESKYSIVKDTIRSYLKSPTISFNFA